MKQDCMYMPFHPTQSAISIERQTDTQTDMDSSLWGGERVGYIKCNVLGKNKFKYKTMSKIQFLYKCGYTCVQSPAQ